VRIYLGGGGSAHDEAALWGEFLSAGMRIVYWPFALAPAQHDGARQWLEGNLAAWGRFRVSMWSGLAGRTAAELSSADLLFVGGGNTFALLDEVVRYDYLPVVRDFLRTGGAFYGGSAGAILAGADISTAAGFDPNDVGLTELGALDLLGGLVVWPHYEVDVEDGRLRAWVAEHRRTVLAIPERSGVVVTDGMARTAGPEAVRLIGPDGGERSYAAGEAWPVSQ
jgi:dipeptidase E